jgi:GNAT superfamily N-acetyltransferase
MAATEPIGIVELDVDDAQAGMVLSTEAGWNQNEADWRFFLSQGVVFGMRDGARLVATAALLPYSAGNAWISMVLVTADFRRRGIATKLVDACLNAAARRGLTPWLDATPAGATVYEPLGFKPGHLDRYRTATSTPWPRAMPAPWASTAAHCCRNLPRVRAPASCLTIEPWPSSATDAPRVISARCWPIAPIRRSRWWMPSSAPRRGRG